MKPMNGFIQFVIEPFRFLAAMVAKVESRFVVVEHVDQYLRKALHALIVPSEVLSDWDEIVEITSVPAFKSEVPTHLVNKLRCGRIAPVG